eukprot:TRINITY_DN63481_c0_g1_i1.p1 TRINITY_DN63481_c0_g1~~TRINITY_DN63481_c0_g1_i1.p1  ORF type:complete len:141 (-),score=4.94 TRINITY_DN63481_c0_g1_i1:36-458(-)
MVIVIRPVCRSRQVGVEVEAGTTDGRCPAPLATVGCWSTSPSHAQTPDAPPRAHRITAHAVTGEPLGATDPADHRCERTWNTEALHAEHCVRCFCQRLTRVVAVARGIARCGAVRAVGGGRRREVSRGLGRSLRPGTSVA